VSCNGLSDGGATASATGGTSPYSYAWSTSATTASITGVTVGNYMVTVSDANGCSSIATVTISEPNILLGNSHVDSNATCDGLPNGGASALPTGGTAPYTYLWSTGATADVITGISVGSYTVTVTDANGCTSIESIIISSNNSTYSFISENACNSYISPSGLFTWTASGTYQDTIPNLAGCDSIITINLTINENGSQQDVTICNGEFFTIGANVYTTSGTYTNVFTNAAGCDSTVITNLTVESVNVAVTQTGFKLEANNTVASYQWINCDSNSAIIPGAINRTYLVTESGNYAVIVTESGCTDTSACVLVDGLGISDFAETREINVYPNPIGLNNGMVTIDVTNTSNYAIIIRDLTGKMIYLEEGLNRATNQIDITNFAAGTYFIEIKTENMSDYKRLIVM
ncbi:MAG: T9SS type A sorting domain-containing protein, partial [Salibacteraceae bacterium]